MVLTATVAVAPCGAPGAVDGIPAEVSMEEEGGQTRQPRRRNAGSRPRRPRRAAGEGEGEAASEAPVLADAASE